MSGDEMSSALNGRERPTGAHGSARIPAETIGEWPEMAERLANQEPTHAGQQALLSAAHAAITRRIEPYQRALMHNAEAQILSLAEDLRRIKNLTLELEAVAAMAADGDLVNLDVYAATDSRAAALVTKSLSAPERAGALASTLEDPLGGLNDLERRMPSLRVEPFNA